MKRNLLITTLIVIASLTATAQVTQLNSNKSLQSGIPISANKAVFISDIDSTLWATDGTPSGTIQINSETRFKDVGGLLNGKLIMVGKTAATGNEVWVTDGTSAGTIMLKDIYPGTTGSSPDDDMALLNGFAYFTAATPNEGRELWRTDGTPAGTTLVKDIVPGTTGSNTADDYGLFSTGTYLLFSATTATQGKELWRSDGTSAGTVVVKDINTGAPSSEPDNFYKYNNMVLFVAKDATHGSELWRTDGTEAGTQLVKDINPNAASSSVDGLFLLFNGRLFFNATDGTHGDELWSTNGTEAGTTLLKDIMPGGVSSYASVFFATVVGNKFFFTSFDLTSGAELWESDGTTAGTKVFMDIVPGSESSSPFIFPAYTFDYVNMQIVQSLFQGNKFFFMADTESEGAELWVSDGTVSGTRRVKDINPGNKDGIVSPSFIYTPAAFYFTADDGVKGNELWKSDGTEAGTVMVADINNGKPDSDVFFNFILGNKLIFSATNGDHQSETDLYFVDVTSATLPIKLFEFTVTPKATDALLQWTTLQEINSKEFVVERSSDGVHFTKIGAVQAAGSSHNKQSYAYTDPINNKNDDIIYYRLVFTDKDDKVEYSKVVSLRLKGATGWNVNLISNPVRDEVKIMLTGVTGKTQLSIVDLNGRTLYSGSSNTNGQIAIPAGNLQTGMYVLVAENNKEKKAMKFIKQ
jgi:ELWxxDGT repeat protein